MKIYRSVPMLLTLVSLLACPKSDTGTSSGTTATPVEHKPAAEQPQKAGGEVVVVRDEEEEDTPSCLKAFKTGGAATERSIAGKKYQRVGDVLTLEDNDGDDSYTFGQLSDIKEDTPENLGNVKALIAWLQSENADALVVTGDLAEGQPAIEHVLVALAEFKGPVLVMIGNREGKTDFAKAFEAVAGAHPNLVNMNEIRVFNADDASLLSLPGYFNPAYIHSQDGCRYTPEDVHGLDALLAAATSTPVLASHGPPRQSGRTGIDRIHEGVNVGDPVLAKYLATKRIKFGLFGNIQEAGGKATDLSGGTEIKAKTWVDSLYLNPGPTDAVRWPMLDETESVGMAGLLRIRGTQGQYQIRRLRPGESKPVKPAAAPAAPAPADEAPKAKAAAQP